MKKCTKCKNEYPANEEYFYKTKYTKDGLTGWCKKCQIEKAKVYQKETYKNGHLKQYHTDRYTIKKDNILSQQKEYLKQNKNKIYSYHKRWRKSDAGKKFMSSYNKIRCQNKTHIINKYEWIKCKEYFNNSCAYCNMTYTEHKEKYNQDLHKEHVSHNGSNDLDNCVPSCKICNSEKHTDTLEDWYNCKNLKYSELKYNKIQKWLNEDYKQYFKK